LAGALSDLVSTVKGAGFGISAEAVGFF